MPIKKKQSKLKRALNSLNPRSLKGGILLFTIVFALGGGGYFLYKSHADPLPAALSGGSAPVFTYVLGPSGLAANGGSPYIWHDSQISSKSSLNQAWHLQTKKGGAGPIQGIEPNGADSNVVDMINNKILKKYPGHRTVACVYARGTSIANSYDDLSVVGIGDNTVDDAAFYGNIGSAYQDYCSKGKTISGSGTNQWPGAYADYNGRSDSTISIAHLTIYVF